MSDTGGLFGGGQTVMQLIFEITNRGLSVDDIRKQVAAAGKAITDAQEQLKKKQDAYDRVKTRSSTNPDKIAAQIELKEAEARYKAANLAQTRAAAFAKTLEDKSTAETVAQLKERYTKVAQIYSDLLESERVFALEKSKIQQNAAEDGARIERERIADRQREKDAQLVLNTELLGINKKLEAQRDKIQDLRASGATAKVVTSEEKKLKQLEDDAEKVAKAIVKIGHEAHKADVAAQDSIAKVHSQASDQIAKLKSDSFGYGYDEFKRSVAEQKKALEELLKVKKDVVRADEQLHRQLASLMRHDAQLSQLVANAALTKKFRDKLADAATASESELFTKHSAPPPAGDKQRQAEYLSDLRGHTETVRVLGQLGEVVSSVTIRAKQLDTTLANTPGLTSATGALEKYKNTHDGLSTEYQKVRDDFEKLLEAFDSGKLTYEEISAGMTAAAKSMGDYEKQIKENITGYKAEEKALEALENRRKAAALTLDTKVKRTLDGADVMKLAGESGDTDVQRQLVAVQAAKKELENLQSRVASAVDKKALTQVEQEIRKQSKEYEVQYAALLKMLTAQDKGNAHLRTRDALLRKISAAQIALAREHEARLKSGVSKKGAGKDAEKARAGTEEFMRLRDQLKDASTKEQVEAIRANFAKITDEIKGANAAWDRHIALQTTSKTLAEKQAQLASRYELEKSKRVDSFSKLDISKSERKESKDLRDQISEVKAYERQLATLEARIGKATSVEDLAKYTSEWDVLNKKYQYSSSLLTEILGIQRQSNKAVKDASVVHLKAQDEYSKAYEKAKAMGLDMSSMQAPIELLRQIGVARERLDRAGTPQGLTRAKDAASDLTNSIKETTKAIEAQITAEEKAQAERAALLQRQKQLSVSLGYDTDPTKRTGKWVDRDALLTKTAGKSPEVEDARHNLQTLENDLVNLIDAATTTAEKTVFDDMSTKIIIMNQRIEDAAKALRVLSAEYDTTVKTKGKAELEQSKVMGGVAVKETQKMVDNLKKAEVEGVDKTIIDDMKTRLESVIEAQRQAAVDLLAAGLDDTDAEYKKKVQENKNAFDQYMLALENAIKDRIAKTQFEKKRADELHKTFTQQSTVTGLPESVRQSASDKSKVDMESLLQQKRVEVEAAQDLVDLKRIEDGISQQIRNGQVAYNAALAEAKAEYAESNDELVGIEKTLQKVEETYANLDSINSTLITPETKQELADTQAIIGDIRKELDTAGRSKTFEEDTKKARAGLMKLQSSMKEQRAAYDKEEGKRARLEHEAKLMLARKEYYSKRQFALKLAELEAQLEGKKDDTRYANMRTLKAEMEAARASAPEKEIDQSFLSKSILKGAVVGRLTREVFDLANKITSLLKNTVTEAIAFNIELSNARLGLAAVVLQSHDLYENQKLITNEQERFVKVMGIAKNMQKDILAVSMRSMVSFSELNDVLMQGSALLSSRGIKLEDQNELINQMLTAQKSIGVLQQQQFIEMRQLLAGDMRRGQLAIQLVQAGKITVQQLRTLRGDELASALKSAMAEFQIAGVMYLNTIKGKWEQLRDTIKFTMAEAVDSQGIMDSIAGILQKVYDLFFTTTFVQGKAVLTLTENGKALQAHLRTLLNALVGVGDVLIRVVTFISVDAVMSFVKWSAIILGVSVAIGTLITAGKVLTLVVVGLKTAMGGWKAALLTIATTIAAVTFTSYVMENELSRLAKSIDETAENFMRFGSVTIPLNQIGKETIKLMNIHKNSLEKIAKAHDDYDKKLRGRTITQAAYNAKIHELADQLSDVMPTAIDKTTESWRIHRDMLQENITQMTALEEAFQQAVSARLQNLRIQAIEQDVIIDMNTNYEKMQASVRRTRETLLSSMRGSASKDDLIKELQVLDEIKTHFPNFDEWSTELQNVIFFAFSSAGIDVAQKLAKDFREKARLQRIYDDTNILAAYAVGGQYAEEVKANIERRGPAEFNLKLNQSDRAGIMQDIVGVLQESGVGGHQQQAIMQFVREYVDKIVDKFGTSVTSIPDVFAKSASWAPYTDQIKKPLLPNREEAAKAALAATIRRDEIQLLINTLFPLLRPESEVRTRDRIKPVSPEAKKMLELEGALLKLQQAQDVISELATTLSDASEKATSLSTATFDHQRTTRELQQTLKTNEAIADETLAALGKLSAKHFEIGKQVFDGKMAVHVGVEALDTHAQTYLEELAKARTAIANANNELTKTNAELLASKKEMDTHFTDVTENILTSLESFDVDNPEFTDIIKAVKLFSSQFRQFVENDRLPFEDMMTGYNKMFADLRDLQLRAVDLLYKAQKDVRNAQTAKDITQKEQELSKLELVPPQDPEHDADTIRQLRQEIINLQKILAHENSRAGIASQRERAKITENFLKRETELIIAIKHLMDKEADPTQKIGLFKQVSAYLQNSQQALTTSLQEISAEYKEKLDMIQAEYDRGVIKSGEWTELRTAAHEEAKAKFQQLKEYLTNQKTMAERILNALIEAPSFEGKASIMETVRGTISKLNVALFGVVGGLREARNEADKLGLTLMNSVNALGDMLNLFNRQLPKFVSSIMSAFDLLGKINKQTIKFSQKGGGTKDFTGIVDIFKNTFSSGKNFVEGIGATAGIIGAVASIGTSIVGIFKSMFGRAAEQIAKDIRKQMSKITEAYSDGASTLITTMTDLERLRQESIRRLSGRKGGQKKLDELLPEIDRQLADLRKQQQKIFEDMAQSLKMLRLEENLRSVQSSFDEVVKKYKEYIDAGGEVATANEFMTLSFDELMGKMDKDLLKAIEDLNKALKDEMRSWSHGAEDEWGYLISIEKKYLKDSEEARKNWVKSHEERLKQIIKLNEDLVEFEKNKNKEIEDIRNEGIAERRKSTTEDKLDRISAIQTKIMDERKRVAEEIKGIKETDRAEKEKHDQEMSRLEQTFLRNQQAHEERLRQIREERMEAIQSLEDQIAWLHRLISTWDDLVNTRPEDWGNEEHPYDPWGVYLPFGPNGPRPIAPRDEVDEFGRIVGQFSDAIGNFGSSVGQLTDLNLSDRGNKSGQNVQITVNVSGALDNPKQFEKAVIIAIDKAMRRT